MSHKLLKRLIPLLGAVTLVLTQSQAAITINISAEKLKTPGGYDMAVEGLLVLVADANGDGFGGPTDTAFVQGDDVMVGIWDIASTTNTPGAFQGSTGSVSFSGDWGEGDPLAVLWFPTLSAADPISSTTSAAAVPYGMYTIATDPAPNGSDLWVTPADGVIGHNLNFITTDATVLSTDGESDPAEGVAMEVTPGTAPLAPTGIAGAADGPGKINVTWTDNATDETGYRIERSISGAMMSWSVLGEVGAGVTMYVDNTAANSTTYKYRVIALRGPSQSTYAVSSDVTSAAPSARLTNLSNRALVGTGDNILIGSFRLRYGPLRIYARVGGPALAGAGISNFLADPTLELIRLSDQQQIAFNDNWKVNASDNSSQQTEIEATFIPPANDVEPALVANLTQEGFYSIIVRGVNDTTGFANVEIYEYRDPNEPNPGKLTNLSNRALVGTGDDILIGSFRVRGDGSQRIYARVGGPALAGAGIANFLADPNLELIRLSDQQQIGFNDSWKIDASDNSSQQTAIEATFIPPANDVEPALVAILNQEGFYSIVVRGVNDTTGFANVEIYDYPQ